VEPGETGHLLAAVPEPALTVGVPQLHRLSPATHWPWTAEGTTPDRAKALRGLAGLYQTAIATRRIAWDVSASFGFGRLAGPASGRLGEGWMAAPSPAAERGAVARAAASTLTRVRRGLRAGTVCTEKPPIDP
jgi:hypothetical protein